MTITLETPELHGELDATAVVIQSRPRLCSHCHTALPVQAGRGRPAVFCSVRCRRLDENRRDRLQRAKERLARKWDIAAQDVTGRDWLASDAWPRMLAGLPPEQRSPVMAVSLSDPEKYVNEMLFMHGPAVDPQEDGLWEAEGRLLGFAALAYEAVAGPAWTAYAPNDIQHAIRDKAQDAMADSWQARDPERTTVRRDIRPAVEGDRPGRREQLDDADRREVADAKIRYPLPPWMK